MSSDQVHASVDLAAPLEPLWALAGAFADLQRWNPLLERFTVEGEGIGAVRTAHFPNYWISERLERRNEEAHVIAYMMPASSRGELVGWSASISLTAIDPYRTRVEWRSEPPAGVPIDATQRQALEAYFRLRIGHLAAAAGY